MTSAVRRAGGEYVAATLAEISDLLNSISDTPLWSSSDSQVTELLVTAARVRNQVDAVRLRVVAEVHGRDIAGRAVASSTQAWLREAVRVTPAEAKQQVVLASALSGGLDQTRRALTDGSVAVSHARVIIDTLEALPPEVPLSTRAEAESFLVEQAQVFDPLRLARLGRRVLDVVDPEAADADEARRLEAQERRAYQRRHLSFTPDGRGSVWLKGQLDTESAAVVRRALDPLAAPRPTDADQPDVRSPGARAADTLVEVCRRALAGGGLPAQRAERPQVVLTVDVDKLRREVGAGVLDTGEELSPGAVRRLACDADLLPPCSVAIRFRSTSGAPSGCSPGHNAER
ncbi:MAG: DUF222 domain-containing protein [Micromonosporaceae bacterium]